MSSSLPMSSGPSATARRLDTLPLEKLPTEIVYSIVQAMIDVLPIDSVMPLLSFRDPRIHQMMRHHPVYQKILLPNLTEEEMQDAGAAFEFVFELQKYRRVSGLRYPCPEGSWYYDEDDIPITPTNVRPSSKHSGVWDPERLIPVEPILKCFEIPKSEEKIHPLVVEESPADPFPEDKDGSVAGEDFPEEYSGPSELLEAFSGKAANTSCLLDKQLCRALRPRLAPYRAMRIPSQGNEEFINVMRQVALRLGARHAQNNLRHAMARLIDPQHRGLVHIRGVSAYSARILEAAQTTDVLRHVKNTVSVACPLYKPFCIDAKRDNMPARHVRLTVSIDDIREEVVKVLGVSIVHSVAATQVALELEKLIVTTFTRCSQRTCAALSQYFRSCKTGSMGGRTASRNFEPYVLPRRWPETHPFDFVKAQFWLSMVKLSRIPLRCHQLGRFAKLISRHPYLVEPEQRPDECKRKVEDMIRKGWERYSHVVSKKGLGGRWFELSSRLPLMPNRKHLAFFLECLHLRPVVIDVSSATTSLDTCEPPNENQATDANLKFANNAMVLKPVSVIVRQGQFERKNLKETMGVLNAVDQSRVIGVFDLESGECMSDLHTASILKDLNTTLRGLGRIYRNPPGVELKRIEMIEEGEWAFPREQYLRYKRWPPSPYPQTIWAIPEEHDERDIVWLEAFMRVLDSMALDRATPSEMEDLFTWRSNTGVIFDHLEFSTESWQ